MILSVIVFTFARWKSGKQLKIILVTLYKYNNSASNLQLLFSRANVSKDTRIGTSIYTGVCWSKSMKRWRAAISINGNRNILGYFYNEIDASNAYQTILATL